MDRVDQGPAILEQTNVDAVARRKHLPLCSAARALEVGDTRLVLDIECDPSSVFTNGNDARRERLTHAANEGGIVNWVRTLRIDAPPDEALRGRVAAALARDGVSVRFGTAYPQSPTYVLVEGPEGVDPVELEQRFPEGTWYGEAIIALAIEPAPADALPLLARALGGPGAPAGVRACETAGTKLIVEFAPAVTQPAMVLRIVDVELRRLHGYRRTELLSVLPMETAAAIASAGLQAPEIAPDRILEALLEAAHVE